MVFFDSEICLTSTSPLLECHLTRSALHSLAMEFIQFTGKDLIIYCLGSASLSSPLISGFALRVSKLLSSVVSLFTLLTILTIPDYCHEPLCPPRSKAPPMTFLPQWLRQDVMSQRKCGQG